jgi:proteasome accessory factor C
MKERELRDDLNLLFMCGLPGYTPGDLIDVTLDGDRITVTNADPIARPLRLTPDEALALVVAGRTLAGVAGLAERDALDRALAKVESAAGSPVDDEGLAVALDDGGATLATLEAALAAGKRVHLEYHSAGRDAMTERDVDPMRVFAAEGHWYLEGWCRRVEGVRLFRLDRVNAVTTLDVAAEPPSDAVGRDLSGGLFEPSPEHTRVVLRLSAAVRWVADYYPVEDTTELPDGGVEVALRAADLAWVRRLLLRLGPDAQAVEPTSLAGDVATAAEAALSAYL